MYCGTLDSIEKERVWPFITWGSGGFFLFEFYNIKICILIYIDMEWKFPWIDYYSRLPDRSAMIIFD